MDKKKHRFHKAVWAVVKVFARPTLWKYSFKTDKVPKIDGPYIIMANHATESDSFMAAMACPGHFYIVSGEHVLRSKFGKIIKNLVDPIPIPKGGSSMGGVKDILTRLRGGANVILFPEGSRSFNGETIPMPTNVGKIVKSGRCALVTYRLQGGYFVAPRWGYKFRKGHVEGKVMGVYTKEELDKMSVQEITDIINRDIYENAYETQRKMMYKYKGKNLAEGLENYLIICPKCGGYDTMTSSGNDFMCTGCGLGGTYDEYGFLRGEELPYDSVYDWGEWMKGRFDEDMAKKPAGERIFLETDVKLYAVNRDHTTTDVGVGEMEVYEDRLVWGDKVFRFENFTAISMLYYGKTLLFTCDGEYYGMTGEHFHAWKSNRLYELYMKKREEEKTAQKSE